MLNVVFYSFVPLITQAENSGNITSAEVEGGPTKQLLVEKIKIPRKAVGARIMQDLSSVDWDQIVQMNGKKVKLYSDEVLNSFDIDPEIKMLVSMYRSDIEVIENNNDLNANSKNEKKIHSKQALHRLIAEKLIQKGELPVNYFEMEIRGQIEDADNVIDTSDKKSIFQLDTKNGKKIDRGASAKIKTNKSADKDYMVRGYTYSLLNDLVNSSTESAFNYLIDHQHDNGSWGSTSTSFVDTVAVLNAFNDLGVTGSTTDMGVEWLDYTITDNNDFYAQKVKLQAYSGEPTTTADILASYLDNTTGGFAFDSNYQPDPATTADVLMALTESEYKDSGDNPDLTVSYALYYLTQSQRFDGGWSAINGGDSTIPVTTKVIEALLPYKGHTLEGFSSQTISIDTYLNKATAWLQNTQMQNGTWRNSLVDTSLAFYTLKKATIAPTYETSTIFYLTNAQVGDGSYANGNIYVTAAVMKALSEPASIAGTLSITDIVPLGTLQTGVSTSVKVLVKNNGGTTVNNGILHLIADGYVLNSFDFSSNSISIEPDQTAEIIIQLPETTGSVGNVTFTASLEGADGIINEGSKFEKILSFSADPTGLPGLPTYFVAQKFVYYDQYDNPQPALNVRWKQKNDANRLNYMIMWREFGSSTWTYALVDNSWNGAFVSPMVEDQSYEVTVGAMALDSTRYVYYSNPAQVIVSSSTTKYATSTVSGTINYAGQNLPDTYLFGYIESAGPSDSGGNYTLTNVPYGKGAVGVSDFRYDQYMTGYVNTGNDIGDLKIPTNLKTDNQNPTVTDLTIFGAASSTISNQKNVSIQYTVDDDESLNGVGYVQSAAFYYYDPHDLSWHEIGTQSGPLYLTETYQWYVPGELLGTGYQLKVVVRDYSGKESSTVWGPFEITTGNSAPQFTFIAPALLQNNVADLNYTIKWNAHDSDDNAQIYLYKDVDQNVSNGHNGYLGVFNEDDFLQQHKIDTVADENASYYIRAVVCDGTNPCEYVYSGQPIMINHQAPSAPTNLLTNNSENPTDVTTTPIFSAIYNDPTGSGDYATDYQVQVSTSTDFSSIYWDSTKTQLAATTTVGSRIPDVTYSGPTLAPSTTYYWRIKLWDAGDAEGEWSSETSTFVTPPGPSPTPGTWQTTTPLPLNLYAAASAAYNGYVYVLGGDKGNNTQSNEVYVAHANADGTLGAWSQVNSFTTTRMLPSSFAANGYLYVIGGSNATSEQIADVQFAPINSDGTLGTWSQTTALPLPLWGHTTAVVGDHVYVFGGGSFGVGNSYTLVSQIYSNGQLGPWVYTTTMPHQAWLQTAFGYNGYLYLIGGSGFQDTYYAIINQDGTLGSWIATTPIDFPTNQGHNQAGAVFGDTLYLAMSGDSVDMFQSAHLNSSGGLSNWSTASQQNPPHRLYPAYTQLNGKFYLLGGEQSEGGTTATNEVLVFTPPTTTIHLPPSAPTDLLTNNSQNPADVTTTPIFSAIYHDTSGAGDYTTSYQIQVATSGSFSSIFWDSTKTALSSTTTVDTRTPDIIYAGPTLTPSTTYYWRTKLWDAGNAEGEWSTETATFSTLPIPGTFALRGDASLAAYWTLDNTSTPAIADHTTYGLSPAGATGGSWVPGRFGEAWYAGVNGANNRLITDSSFNNFDLSTDIWETNPPINFSMGGWYKFDDNSNGYIFNFDYAAGGPWGYGRSWGAFANGSGSIVLYMLTNNTEYDYTLSADHLWHHLLLVNSGASWAWYVDGLRVYDNQVTGNWVRYQHSDFSLGKYDGINGSGGIALDDWFVLRRAMTSNEVSDLYNSSHSSNTPSAPTDLQVNGYTNPTDVTTTPTFLAVYNDLDTSDIAWFYQVQVSTSSNFSSIQWDSTKTALTASATEGSRTPDITYAGPTLTPSTTYYWRIKLWDAGNAEGEWSTETATFSTLSTPLTPGTWQTTSPLPVARYAAASASYNDYVYVLGGDSGNNIQHNDVYVAHANPDGTLGSWSQVNSFATPRMLASSFAASGFLYVIGGANATSEQIADVQFAPINSDGTIGSWAQTTAMPYPGWGQATTVVGDKVYVLGGNAFGVNNNRTLVSQIQPNGQLGPWTSLTPMPHQAWLQTAFGHNGYLYVLGGYGYQDTYYAPINQDGTIGSWVATSPLDFPTTMGHSQAGAVIGNTVYLQMSGDFSTDLFESAHLNSSGGLSSWSTVPLQDNPPRRLYPGNTQLNGRFYLLGGETNEGGIQNVHNEVLVYTP